MERPLESETGIFVTAKADILVVDDDSQVAGLFSTVLRAEGYRVREALSGEEGLESARAEHPDVMLLDVRLPDLSGIEVCRRIKAEPALAGVFVIMVSGEAMSAADRVQGLEVGADEYLAKPVALNELQARIRTALRLRDTAAALRVSEEYHRRLIEILPDALCVLDLRGRMVTVNSQAVAMLGYAEARELRRKSLLSLVPSKARGRLRADIAVLSRTGILQNAQYEVARKDGSQFPIALSASQIKDSGGRTIGRVCVARDISDEKRAEKQRTAFSELGYRLSAAATPEEAAKVILDIACDLFDCDAGHIDLYSQADDKMIAVLAVDTTGGRRMLVPPSGLRHEPTSLMRLVMEEGSRLTNQGDQLPAGVELLPFGDVTRRSACRMHVPIRAKGIVHGVLSVQSYTPGAYSPDDLRLLETLAGHCGHALQRINATEGLREAEARYRSIFENATEGIFQSTLEGRLLNANPGLARMLGYETPEELRSSITNAGQQVYVNPGRRKELRRLSEEKGSVQGFEAELLHKDRRRIWVTINAHLVRDGKGAVLYLEGTAQDITERKRLEKALLEVSEREQRLVGQDIHDGLCQRLFCTAIGCNLLQEHLATQSRPEAAEAAKILAQLQAAIGEARSLAHGLSLANLDKRGLAAALGDLASTTTLDCHVPCTAECPGSVPITDPATATHLYRIAREAVHNAVKHARPSRILIRLEATADGLRLGVEDDGRGIPEGQSLGSGMGFGMMRYRANMLGGELKIQRAPCGGTIVTCTFPENAFNPALSH